MSKNGVPSLSYQIRQEFNEYFSNGKGTSKYKDKKGLYKTGILSTPMSHKLYNDRTMKQYLTQCIDIFIPWAKEHHPELKYLQDFADPSYGMEYVEYLKTRYKSSCTVCTYYAAAAKACGWSRLQVTNVPSRYRKDITKNRHEVPKRFYTGKYAELTHLIEHTGMRRKNAKRVTGKDLFLKDGVYYVHLDHSKGGKMYDAEVIGTPEEIERVVSYFKAAGSEKVINTIVKGKVALYSDFPAHVMRGIYAAACYKKAVGITGKTSMDHASGLPKKKRYHCQGENSDIVFNRDALQYTTLNLGHYSVAQAANHYLYSIIAEMREER